MAESRNPANKKVLDLNNLPALQADARGQGHQVDHCYDVINSAGAAAPGATSGAARVWHRATFVFLVGLFLLGAVRARDQHRWSDWGFGDAQTLLCLKNWNENGWLANRLLFIPQGHFRDVAVFDDPLLRHHAHGISPTSSPGVGPRLWYTHYPPGYLIPYALLFRAGLTDPFPARLLSLLFSVGALGLMYLTFARLTSPGAASGAVLFYALGRPFLGYADSLANQPLDDLLRFAFLLAIVQSTRAPAYLRRRWAAAAWAIEFVLSLCSFDSVIFVFLWLLGWDRLEGLGFRWKRYAVFALAPLAAHSLQLVQNVWYLGMNGGIADISATYFARGSGPGGSRLLLSFVAIWNMFSSLGCPLLLACALVLAYWLFRRFPSLGEDPRLPSMGLLGVLFACAMGFVVALPVAALMSYQGRQLAPFVALLVSATTAAAFRIAARLRAGAPPALWLLGATLFTTGGLAWGSLAVADKGAISRWDENSTDVNLATQLAGLPTSGDPVFFSLNAFTDFLQPVYFDGRPQIAPALECYAGSRPILCETTPEQAADDLAALVRLAPHRFSPVLVAKEPAAIAATVEALRERQVSVSGDYPVKQVSGMYVADLTQAVCGSENFSSSR